jgi:hypothetical protein
VLWELSVPISPPPGRSSKRWLTTALGCLSMSQRSTSSPDHYSPSPKVSPEEVPELFYVAATAVRRAWATSSPQMSLWSLMNWSALRL